MKCGKVKNPCKICFQPVSKKNGLQCQGACQKWSHFACLNYTPGKINDIKAGILKITCPCPDCNTSVPNEQFTEPPFTCTNKKCPAAKFPICTSAECPSARNISKNCPKDLEHSPGRKNKHWSYTPEHKPGFMSQYPSPTNQSCTPETCSNKSRYYSHMTGSVNAGKDEENDTPWSYTPERNRECQSPSSRPWSADKPGCESQGQSSKNMPSPKMSKSYSSVQGCGKEELPCSKMRPVSSEPKIPKTQLDQKLIVTTIERLCYTVDQLTEQLKDLVNKLTQ